MAAWTLNVGGRRGWRSVRGLDVHLILLQHRRLVGNGKT